MLSHASVDNMTGRQPTSAAFHGTSRWRQGHSATGLTLSPSCIERAAPRLTLFCSLLALPCPARPPPQGLTHVDIQAAVARKTEIYLQLAGVRPCASQRPATVLQMRCWAATRTRYLFRCCSSCLSRFASSHRCWPAGDHRHPLRDGHRACCQVQGCACVQPAGRLETALLGSCAAQLPDSWR